VTSCLISEMEMLISREQVWAPLLPTAATMAFSLLAVPLECARAMESGLGGSHPVDVRD